VMLKNQFPLQTEAGNNFANISKSVFHADLFTKRKRGYSGMDSLLNIFSVMVNPAFHSPVFFPLFWQEQDRVFHLALPSGDLPDASSPAVHARYAIWKIFPWPRPHQTVPVLHRAKDVSDIKHLCKKVCGEPYRLAALPCAASQAPSGDQAEPMQELLMDCTYRSSE
jgi:hypothetical protein